ncbi:hypothetical protein GCK32_010310 [Trichostrongylus colubriformis]|uniref:Uncharacterized protein n=1 Tax=Trichostrongylus colubriformis TaxID=6319 RepID=A0AAN8FNM5_TRICO
MIDLTVATHWEMCVSKKKSSGSPDKSKVRPASAAGKEIPKGGKEDKPAEAAAAAAAAAEKKSAEKDGEKEDPGHNILAKPVNDADLKEKKKEPLHIKVPPPRVMKAKRPMKEVKEAKDPEYKTIAMDNSEWESAKVLKRSDIKPEDIQKKEFKETAGTDKRVAVEAAA